MVTSLPRPRWTDKSPTWQTPKEEIGFDDGVPEYLADKFNSGIKYSETEVNAILYAQHSFNDPATLRRLLYGTGRLDRTIDGREYWKI